MFRSQAQDDDDLRPAGPYDHVPDYGPDYGEYDGMGGMGGMGDYGDYGGMGGDYGDYGGEEEELEMPEGPYEVEPLGKKNFTSILKNLDGALVEFYAPWCGHCQKLEPHYEYAARHLKDSEKLEGKNVKLFKVDATVEEALAKEMGVEGFPTMKWFEKGELKKTYQSGRDQYAISGYVERQMGEPSMDLTTMKVFTGEEAPKKENKVKEDGDEGEGGEDDEDEEDEDDEKRATLIAVFDELGSSPDFTNFYAMAKDIDLEDLDIAHTDNRANVAKLGLTNFKKPTNPAMVLMFENEKGEKSFAEYDGKWEAKEVTKFAAVAQLPWVIPFEQENINKVFESGVSVQLLVFYDGENEEAAKELTALLEEVSKEDNKSGKILFVIVDIKGSDAEGVLEYFDVTVGEDEFQPQAVIFSQPDTPEPVNKDEKEEAIIEEGQKKFKLENAPTITKPILQQFIKAFEAGLLQEHLKSEPIPDENYGPLYKVVGENFDEMVADSDTDVFLEVYAPWCGHCKELAPTIKKLAKRFKDVPTVKICDMDGTANEHPLVKDAKGFPAIYFFPAGGKGVRIPWDEEEKRTVGGFTRFIQANAKHPFELPKIKSKEEKAAEREAKRKAKEYEEAHEEL